MEGVPPYVSIVFLLTTFLAVGIFLYAVRVAGRMLPASNRTAFLLALWIVFQSSVAYFGIYLLPESTPPKIFVFGIFPALIGVALFLFWWSRSNVGLSLRILTAIHIVRIPVEIVLYWLHENGLVPNMMTFNGINFDIATGILAILVLLFGFRGGSVNRPLLIAFNVIGLIMLAIVVSIAAMSMPGPMQLLNLENPNTAVLYFPYAFLPTIVVPLVLFSHIESLRQLIGMNRTKVDATT